jgi:hypothetical protein
MNVIVIGGGVSGLTSSIVIAKRGYSVTVLERYNKSLKKVLVTGNGKCNYWNDDFTSEHFYSNNKTFINDVITSNNIKMVEEFFDSIGLVPTIKNGYYYPLSGQASSVRNSLLYEAEKNGVKIINDANVTKVEYNNKFIVHYNNEIIEGDKLVIATGSNAYYEEKSLGYELAKSFGHTINKVMPSLVQLIDKNKEFKDCSGVRSNAALSIYVDNELIKQETGEVQLTEYGISGICTFNISGIANRALNNNKKVKVSINFLNTIDDIDELINKRSKLIGDRTIDSFFEEIVNYKLINTILNKRNIDKKLSWNSLDDKDKKIIINDLTNYELEIVDSKSFNSAQVCTGGVDTNEIDSSTMESKKQKGLYIVGELLDVDGECGGYNLGFAFLSGIISGRSV